jgi:hypothetical protein
LPGNADRVAIKINRRHSTGTERLGSDRQDARARPKVEGSEVGGKNVHKVREKPQASRRRGMLAGAKRHSSGNKDAAHFRTSLFPAMPGLWIGKDFQLSADRERSARPSGITCPDMLRKLAGPSSKSADEFSGLGSMTVRLDLESIRIWPRNEDDVRGSKKPQTLDPRILPFLRAEANPTVQASTRVGPLGFSRSNRRGGIYSSMRHCLRDASILLRSARENLTRKLRKYETGKPGLSKTRSL